MNPIRSIPAYALITLFLLALAPQALAQVTVTVVTDRQTYVAGNWVSVSGTVSQVSAGVAVTVEIKKPDGSTWAYDITTPTAAGTWSITNINKVTAVDPVGTYTVIATYGTLGSASTTFTVGAPITISLTPNKMSYNRGETVTVTGTVSRVEAGQQVTVEIKKPDGSSWAFATATPAADGKWTAANINTFTAADPVGTYTITATYIGVSQSTTVTYTGRTIVSSLAITSVALTPSTVQPGATYTISVSISNNVTTTSVTANGTALTLTSGTTQTGTWTATLTAPTALGAYTIQVSATDTTGKTATATTTLTVVLATITLEPNFGVAGSTIAFTGSNFTPDSTVTLTVDYQGLAVKLTTAKATVTGSVSGTFKVPSLPAGVYIVSASDGIRTTTTKLGVGLLIPSTLTIQVSAASLASPGQETAAYILTTSEGAPVDVSFKLAHYTAPFLSNPVTLPTPTRISTGFYQITFKAPTQPGAYLIQVTAEYTNPDGRTVSANGQAVLTVTAAPASATEVQTLADQIKSISNSINTLTNQVNELRTALNTLSTNLDKATSALATQIDNVQKTLTDKISATQTALSQSLGATETKLTSEIGKLSTTLTTVETNLKNEVNKVTTSINTIADRLAATQNTVNSVNTALSGVSSSIASLREEVGSINAGVSTASTFVLVVTALAVIILVLELAVLIRRR
ncbi:MAG: hypothetical protein QW158_01255 [Nitrososphaerales archaeon]